MKRRLFLAGSATGLAAGFVFPAFAQGGALPSWNNGPSKQSILDFIARTTTSGGRD
jgi:hypothetical protein